MSTLLTSDLTQELKNITATYTNDIIFIFGKGPSIDLIKPEAYNGSLLIGINDAERITPCDITIFHANWVAEAIKENGCSSRLYLTNSVYELNNKPQIKLPYVKFSQASSDLIMQRFMSDEMVIEDILFITALKIAKEIASIRGRKQTVYMVGFDFNLSLGISQKLKKDYATDGEEEGAMRVSMQEFYFINALYFLRDSSLDVKHVGIRNFSAITSDQLNSSLIKNYHKSKHVGKVAIVAELTTNHFGSRTRLEQMIRASKIAGADYVKLQKRNVETFYTTEQLKSPYISPFGKTFADYRYQLELSKDDFEFINNLCKEIGIRWFASVLDETSFEFMLELDPELIKLPSTISEHKSYLKWVGNSYGGGIVLSTGMTDKAYEDFVLNNFTACNRLYLLQCNSAYPTPLHDCNIGVVRHYHELSKKNPRIIPGYSSHDYGWKASSLAVAAGARMVEKHVKLGNTEWAHFDAVAVDLTSQAFVEYVDQIRETELIMGNDNKEINQSEHHKYFK